MNKNPEVLILMSTWNGIEFLQTQIDSILAQEKVNVTLFIRDDGSSDGTQQLLNQYSQNFSNIQWYQGDNIKPAKSFMDLIYKSSNQYDYYAFSDQDDYWLPLKLYSGIQKLRDIKNQKEPLLYFSKKNLVDRNLKDLNYTDSYVRDVSLGAALLKSVASGCTMIFNAELFAELQSYHPINISMHDAWVYRVATALGQVVYDSNSYILYRQHGNNTVGAELMNRQQRWIHRLSHLRSRKKNLWYSNLAKELIKGYANKLEPDKYQLIYNFSRIPESVVARFKLIFSTKLKSQKPRNIIFLKTFILLGWM